MQKQNLWLPTCPSRRSQASELIDKPFPAHLYELPFGILVGVQEVRDQPYLRVSEFEVIVILKVIITIVEEVYVMVGES